MWKKHGNAHFLHLYFNHIYMCFTPQTSLTSDTDAALSSMKEIEDVVREDQQSLTVHVSKHVLHQPQSVCVIIHPAIM